MLRGHHGKLRVLFLWRIMSRIHGTNILPFFFLSYPFFSLPSYSLLTSSLSLIFTYLPLSTGQQCGEWPNVNSSRERRTSDILQSKWWKTRISNNDNRRYENHRNGIKKGRRKEREGKGKKEERKRGEMILMVEKMKTGPFGDVFNRKYIPVSLPDPQWRSYDGPNPQKKVFNLPFFFLLYSFHFSIRFVS